MTGLQQCRQAISPASDAQELVNVISELATMDTDLVKTFREMEVRWTVNAVRKSTCCFLTSYHDPLDVRWARP